MVKNIGRLDQVLRAGISIGLIYIAFTDDSPINDTLSGYIIGGIGIVSLFVSIIRYCPLYALADISTCPKKDK